VLIMSRLVCAAAAFAAFATPTVAAAQSSADAESLFREARALVKAGRVAEGCDAFESSQRIEPTVPTLLNLADCRERNQQLASAWGHFVAAAQQTRGDRSQAAAQATAQRRAAVLEPRLSYLVVAVPDDSRVDGLVVSRNGVALDPGMWNRSLPVDGGDYVVEGKAPGHEPWSTRVTVAVEGDRRSVEVPRFKALPALSPVAPPVPASARASAGDDAGDGTAVEARVLTRRRWIAVGVAGGAVVLAGTGIGLGLHALDLDRNAVDRCGDGCAPEVAFASEAQRSRARHFAMAANVSYGVASAAAVGAAVLWLLGRPSSRERSDGTALSPTVGAVTGVQVQGRF
jgi:hypothetical protein